MGYEGRLMVDNLQTNFVLIQIFIFMLMVLLILRVLKVRWQRAEAWYNKLYSYLFWNSIFRFLIEMYLELSFDSMVNLNGAYVYEPKSYYEHISLGMAYGCLVVLAVFPLYIVFFLGRCPENDLLNDKELFKNKGSIYEGLKIKGKRG